MVAEISDGSEVEFGPGIVNKARRKGRGAWPRSAVRPNGRICGGTCTALATAAAVC